MFTARQIQMFFGTLIGVGLVFGLAWLMLYLNKRGIKTHPGKGERRYNQRGRAKEEKRRNRRRYRF